MKGVDTNILVRQLTNDDPKLAAAAEAIIRKSGAPPLVQPVVICKLIWVLQTTYSYSREETIRAVEAVLRACEVADRALVEGALADYADGRGDFPDYYIGRANQRAGADSTLTFDRKLRNDSRFELIRG